MKKLFISCGQRTTQEIELGEAVGELVDRLTPFEPYFAENQSDLKGLTDHILSALNESAGLIAVLHNRGEVCAGDEVFTRASVWIEQEIAVATFITQVLQRHFRFAAFLEEGVVTEGMRKYLIANPYSFKSDNEVLKHLGKLLPTWTEIRGSDITVRLDFLEQSIESDRHEYLLLANVTNNGGQILRPSHAELEIPKRVLFNSSDFFRLKDRETKTHAFFRKTELNPLFPGDSQQVFQEPYYMDGELFWSRVGLLDLPVRFTVFFPDHDFVRVERPFRELQVF